MTDNTFGQNAERAPQPVGGSNSPSGGSFYNEHGQIADEEVSMDVAYAEKDQGRDAALLREQALKNEIEIGLTEDEAINLEKVELLVKNFPFVFEKQFDESGCPEYTINPSAGWYNLNTVENYLGGEKRSRVFENDKSNREIRMKYSSPQQEKLPFGTLFESFSRSDRLITFTKDGVQVSTLGRDKDLNNYQKQIIPLSSFEERHIRILTSILGHLDEIKEIEREVSVEIQRSKTVRNWESIIEETVKGTEE